MTAISHPDDGAAQLTDPGSLAADQASEQHDWLRFPAVQGLLALALYLLVWLPTSARLQMLHLNWADLDQKSMDPNFYAWGLRWWPYAIGHGLNPLFSHQIGAPRGYSLAWVTTAPPVALLAIPLTLTAGPVVAFNLVAAIALPVSAWAAFVLCRRLTGKFWASLAGGVVFGFSAYEANHNSAGQLNLTYSLLLPLLAYLVVVWWQGSMRNRTFVMLAGLTIAVQFYLFMETFAGLTGLGIVALVIGFALAGRPARQVIVRLARLLGVAYAIAVVLAAPYLAYAFRTKTPTLKAKTELDVASLVLPRPQRTFGIAWLTHAAGMPIHSSQAGYVGIPLLVLAILLAVTGWRSTLVRFLTCMLAFIIVAAFGPVVYVGGTAVAKLPWASLWHLPIVRNAYPSRLMVFAYLVLAVATALWLAGPAKQVPWARWALGVLVLASVALDTPTNGVAPRTNVPAFMTSAAYQRTLSRGEIVAVVSEVGNAGMLWQAQSGFYMRLAGGFINQAINRKSDLPPALQGLASPTPAKVAAFEKFVRTDHVGAILVDARQKPRWATRIFRQLGLTGHRIGDVIVYQTDGCQNCIALTRQQLSTP